MAAALTRSTAIITNVLSSSVTITQVTATDSATPGIANAPLSVPTSPSTANRIMSQATAP